MKQSSEEKLTITNKDFLRRRHAGNYTPIDNGELYLLPYEVQLKEKPPEFFEQLSDYDFLKPHDATTKLTFAGLKNELSCLDDSDKGNEFWKNFNGSALNEYLNPILGITKKEQGRKKTYPKSGKETIPKKEPGWKKTYLKSGKETDSDKPFHNDMLKCIYLLAHMHKASPSYIRQLAEVGDAWSTDLRVYYPRKDFEFSEEYSGYLAELYANILFYQPQNIRKVVKNLDVAIEMLVKYADSDWIAPFLERQTKDTDSPSLKILKFNQVASIRHFEALNTYLKDKISGTFSNKSFSELEAKQKHLTGAQIVANTNQYKLVAAICMRLAVKSPIQKKQGNWVSEKTYPIPCSAMDLCIDTITNALAADALRQLKIESEGTKCGKKDTSIPAAIKKLVQQNPQSVDDILNSNAPDCANVPEVFAHYLRKRSEYAVASIRGRGLKSTILSNWAMSSFSVLKSMEPHPNTKKVLDYIERNNLSQINADIEELERKLPEKGFIYDYALHDLPKRV
ncbi:hypothetical protein ACEI25_001420 [Photobacterium damselae]